MDYFISNIGEIQHYYLQYNRLYEYNLEDEDTIQWKKSSIGFKKSNVQDKSIRNSQYATQAYPSRMNSFKTSPFNHSGFTFEYNNDNFNDIENFYKKYNMSYYDNFIMDNHIIMKTEWKLLKYNVGGKFNCHVDGVQNEKHLGTMILLPPKSLSEYEGGELVLYKDEQEIIVNSDEMNWTFVFIPTNMKHEIKEVTKGIRFSFVKPFILHDSIYYLMLNKPFHSEIIDIDKIKKHKVDTQIQELKHQIQKLEANIQELETSNEPKNSIDIQEIKYKLDELSYNSNKYKDFILILTHYIDSNNIADIDYDDYQIFKIISQIKPHHKPILINCFANIYINPRDNDEEYDENTLNETFDNYVFDEDLFDYSITLPSFPKVFKTYVNKKQPGILIECDQEYNDQFYELNGNRKVSIIYFKKN